MWEAFLAVQLAMAIVVVGVALSELHRTSKWVNFRRWVVARRQFRELPVPGWKDALQANDEGEFDIAMLDTLRPFQRRLVAPLAWLRLLGVTASALGFLAVALNFSWLHQDHGLLDLDPTRLAREVAHRSAISVALAVATSAGGMALRATLRTRVRAQLDGLATIERVARSRWTGPRAR